MAEVRQIVEPAWFPERWAEVGAFPRAGPGVLPPVPYTVMFGPITFGPRWSLTVVDLGLHSRELTACKHLITSTFGDSVPCTKIGRFRRKPPALIIHNFLSGKLDTSLEIAAVSVMSLRMHRCNNYFHLSTLSCPSFPDRVALGQRTLGGPPCIHRSMARTLKARSATKVNMEAPRDLPLDGSTTLLEGKDRASALRDSTSCSVRSTA
jgi:hypothetical protein